MVYLTNRFYVALRLFSNISQMMSKCVKNKELAHEPQAYIYRALFLFGVSDVFTKFWWLLWSTEQTHGNMESICFIQWTERKKKINLPCTIWLFNDLCQFSHFLSHIRYFSFFCFFFSSLSYLCTVSTKSFSMPEWVGGITLGIFGWGYAAGTQETLAYTRASSAEATLY